MLLNSTQVLFAARFEINQTFLVKERAVLFDLLSRKRYLVQEKFGSKKWTLSEKFESKTMTEKSRTTFRYQRIHVRRTDNGITKNLDFSDLSRTK